MATTVVDLMLEEIHPSPFNHRKAFRDMEQLAESIKSRGVLQPVTVRKNGKGYELIFGERRWRAAKMAELEAIPAIVRTMTDVEVLEAQLIENVQRADVHPLEEADGYRALMDKHGYTAEQIAAKTGKSKATIYARLKLCDLAPVPRKAFLAEQLVPSVALMIARIPDAKLQAQATNEVLGRGDYSVYHHTGISSDRDLEVPADGDKVEHDTVPLSVREAQVHIQRKYMLRLEQAPFDRADATLVAKAGACTACPKRTGNQRELFADVKSADVCTDPACFETKKKADWDRKAAAAARDGARVLSDKEAQNVFYQWGTKTEVSTGSAYVDPADKLPYELDPNQRKTWKSVLGGELGKVAKAVAQDGAGAARTLLDKQSAIAALKKSGKLKEVKAESKAASRGASHYKDEQKKRAAAAKRKHAIVRLAAERIVADVEENGGNLPGLKGWRWFAHCIVRAVDAEDGKRVIARRGLEQVKKKGGYGRDIAETTLGAWIDAKDRTLEEIMALCAELLAVFRACGVWQTNYGDNFRGAVEAFGLDLKKLASEADKAKPTKPAAKKAPKKKGGAR